MKDEQHELSMGDGNYSGNASSIVSGLAPATTAMTTKQIYHDYSLSESPDPIASSTIFKQRQLLSNYEKTLSEERDDDRRSSSGSTSSSSLGVLSSKTLKALSSDFIKVSPEKMRSCVDRFDKTKKLNDSIRSFGIEFDDNNDISVPEVKINRKELDDMLLNISGFSNVSGQEFKAMSENEIMDFMNREEDENKIQHRFIQEAVVQPNASGYDTSTWSIATTSEDVRIERPSWIETNASSVSMTTYLQAASCPLGILGENKTAIRPSFGMPVVSPVHKRPVSLVDESSSLDKRTTIETEMNLDRSIDDDLVSDNDDSNTTISSMKSYQCQMPLQQQNQTVLQSFQENTTQNAVGNRTSNESVDVLSLSTIGKLIGDMSLGANASRLAEVILKAKDDLSKQRTTRLLLANKTAIVRSDLSMGIEKRSEIRSASNVSRIEKRSENRAVGDVLRTEMKENTPKSDATEIFRKRKHTNQTSSAAVDALLMSSPTIFTNKRMLGFGCVAVAHSASQFVTLQNRSKDEVLHLKVSIKNDSNSFQILNADTDGCILLHPNESFQLKILFKPSMVKFYRDRIVLNSASNVQKFCIPVMGYGGCAKLMVTNLGPPKGSRFDVTIKYFDGKHSPIKLILKNCGSTATFFKSFVYSDIYCSTLAKNNVVSVNPPCGVIAESAQMIVDIVYTGPIPESGSENSFLSCVGLRWGEELTRRRLREWEKVKNRPVFIKMTKFTDEFHGEKDVHCLYDSRDVNQQPLPEDARFFVGHLREYQIYLFAQDDYLDDCSRSFFPLRFDQTTNGAGDS